jgi:hypothetical protein
MKREMEIFDVMTSNRDKRVIAVAQGGDLEVKDDNLPAELVVKTNIPGKLEGGAHIYLGADEGIKKMQIAEGMQVNVFASEEMFPELINPVQMAVDPDGKLFASVWPSYPHWNPTLPRTDRLLCFPDENRDGVADECIVFADKLNSVTGFEFWGGGVLVAAPPEIWFLKDTDGDNVADKKIRMLQGLSSADSHHSANAFVIGPGGGLHWSRGIFNVASMETPTKTFRSGQSGVYRLDRIHTVTSLTNGDSSLPMTARVELDLMSISEKGSATKNGLLSEYVRLLPQESYPAATFLNTITAISWFVIASDFSACCSIRSSTTERILSPRKSNPF